MPRYIMWARTKQDIFYFKFFPIRKVSDFPSMNYRIPQPFIAFVDANKILPIGISYELEAMRARMP
jgi:hypothetical protein